METEHSWCLCWQLILNVVHIVLALKFRGIRTLETSLKCHLHLDHDLGADQLFEIGLVGTSIPIVSNMTTVHDLTVDITQVLVGYCIVLGEVVMEHITTYGQVTIVERVELGPALGAELSAT